MLTLKSKHVAVVLFLSLTTPIAAEAYMPPSNWRIAVAYQDASIREVYALNHGHGSTARLRDICEWLKENTQGNYCGGYSSHNKWLWRK